MKPYCPITKGPCLGRKCIAFAKDEYHTYCLHFKMEIEWTHKDYKKFNKRR